MTILPALAMAPAAQAWLADTTSARVLNVFDRACNMVNPHGDVLAVVTSERGLTPFAVVVAAGDAAPFRVVTDSSQVRVQGHYLHLGSLTIDFSTACPWNAAPGWPSIRRVFADGACLAEIAARTFGHGLHGSLLGLFAPAGQAGSLPSALRTRAQPAALDLAAGMTAGSVDRCVAGVHGLAGLGGGLTPAGDDFILGVLLAAWAGLYGPGAERLGAPIAEAATPRTTTLSAAYLRAAARGECSVYWHRVFEALLRSDAADLSAALLSLLAVGHTSGADALAGFLAVHIALPRPALGPRLTPLGG